jgi:hypothetical protein
VINIFLQARLTTGVHLPPTGVPALDESIANASLKLFGDLIRAGGGKVTESDNIDAARWRKVLW